MLAATSSPSMGGAHRLAAPTDCCWTMPIVAACANFLFTMPETNSGLFYVLFLDKFGVNREAVSWPRTISIVMSHLMGFVIGALQHRVSTNSMVVTGAVLCPAAMIASAFVPSIQWMMLTFGVFYGISQGFLLITISVYMVSCFHKYRSTATGLKYLGASISGIAGPWLLSSLQEKYGFGGMFVMLGGLTLHLIPLAVLLQTPRPTKLSRCSFGIKCVQNAKKAMKSASILTECSAINWQYDSGKWQRRSFGYDTSPLCTLKQSSTNKKNDLDNLNIFSRQPRYDSQASRFHDDRKNIDEIFLQAATILKAPVFYAILVPIVASEFTLGVLASTIVDYAGDKGVPKETAALLVTWLSVGGFFGLLVVTVLADKVPHGRCVVASVTFVLVSVCLELMPHLQGFMAIAVVTAVFGVQQGYLLTIKAVLIADNLGVHSLPIAWSLVAVVSLPLTLCEPSIVGLFRDSGGSYDNLYRLCGAIGFMAAVLLLVKACNEVAGGRQRSTCLKHKA